MASQNVKTGSCFCNQVKFEISEEPKAMYLCHCFNCKKLTGSEYSAQIWYPSTSFKYTAGEEHVIATHSEEKARNSDKPTNVSTFYCGKCHARLYTHIFEMKDTFHVPAGAMDDTEFFKPNAEFFVKRRCTWQKELDGARQFTELGNPRG